MYAWNSATIVSVAKFQIILVWAIAYNIGYDGLGMIWITWRPNKGSRISRKRMLNILVSWLPNFYEQYRNDHLYTEWKFLDCLATLHSKQIKCTLQTKKFLNIRTEWLRRIHYSIAAENHLHIKNRSIFIFYWNNLYIC